MPARISTFHRLFWYLSLSLALILVSCAQTVPPTPSHAHGSAQVVRWIQQHAIPLRTVNPGGSDADLAPFKQIVGHASTVGLGEETHGTHEFIELKARLTEYLISTMGFTTFLMENDWGSSHLLDAYINGGSGDITQVMSQSLFGSWQTQEYLALFEWMRAYNANPVHPTKIHFLGMDCQGVSQSDFDAVEQFVHQVAPQQETSIQNLYNPIISSSLPSAYTTYVSLNASTKQQYQNQAQQVYDFLQAHQQDFIRRSSPQGFALALQNARMIVQFTTYYNSSTKPEALAHYYQRDTFMAENVEWIHDHEAGTNPGIIIWAHDAHIANDTSYPSQDSRNMGGELHARYNDSYVPLGTTLYRGTMRVYFYPDGLLRGIPAPPTNSYNYTLGQAGLALYMLTLRDIPPGPVSDWVRGPAIFVNYGLGGENLSTQAVLSQWFDVIIHVQSTTPANHL